MASVCSRYMTCLDEGKTERESARLTVSMAEEQGYRNLRELVQKGEPLTAGDKVYYMYNEKLIVLYHIGKEPLESGMNILGAHIDSPRMDVKQNPLYENGGFAYLDTHYYGGIKKYQWVTLPLAIHGVVVRKDGSRVNISVGEKDTDPVFTVSDLLIHLSREQLTKTASKVVEGESLDILVGSIPQGETDSEEEKKEKKDTITANICRILEEEYGFEEEDFISAELEVVPAGKTRELGFDRSMIAAYGHDDRVCAYAELEPIFDLETPTHTAVCILADKEEIGSVGISGMQSHAFEYFMEILCDGQGVKLSHCFANSFCLSADVSNAFDPNFPETCDKRNNSALNYGISICKYTGARGKGGASDASAEAMLHVRKTFEDNGVLWQIATLGKVDQGGGGTVAAYMANRNIVTVDAGVPVLNMHAPMELVSKLDCYMTMLGCKAIYLA